MSLGVKHDVLFNARKEIGIMGKVIETYAKAKRMPAGETVVSGKAVVITNEGQSCMCLVPRWANWGNTLEDGSRLEEGKTYKITIEIPG